MGEYDRSIIRTLAVIKRKGQLVTWRQLNRTPDISEPWKVTSAQVDKTPSVLFLTVNKETRETLHYMRDSNELKDGAVVGLMGAVDFTPALADVVIRNGKQLNIASIDTLAPNGQPILYTIEFKG
jgi:hypothetical protein